MKSIASLLAFLALTGCAASRRGPSSPDAGTIDAEAQRLMKREGVAGLALAVIETGRAVHVAAYGRRNVERGFPLTVDTVMYGASLTKSMFAYVVLSSW